MDRAKDPRSTRPLHHEKFVRAFQFPTPPQFFFPSNFVSTVLPNLQTRLGQRSKSNGAPTLIFLAGAALRVADATRVLKDKKLRGDKGCEVAKLFAKHFKLSDHVSYLKRTKVGAAVGTPGRIGKLLCETGMLFFDLLIHLRPE